MSKYGAVKTEVDGIVFASKKEAKRYNELKILIMVDEITSLTIQPEYPIVINGHKICVYIADFKYWDRRKNAWVVEDVKGMKTPVYKLKKKLTQAMYKIKIVEI